MDRRSSPSKRFLSHQLCQVLHLRTLFETRRSFWPNQVCCSETWTRTVSKDSLVSVIVIAKPTLLQVDVTASKQSASTFASASFWHPHLLGSDESGRRFVSYHKSFVSERQVRKNQRQTWQGEQLDVRMLTMTLTVQSPWHCTVLFYFHIGLPWLRY